MTTYIIGYMNIKPLGGEAVRKVGLPDFTIPVLVEGHTEKLIGHATNLRLQSHLILADTDAEVPEGSKMSFGSRVEDDVYHIGYLMVVLNWSWGNLPNTLEEFNRLRCTLCNYTACMYDCNTPPARMEL